MATVPIVTEVTKAELDALVAANGLNEGLQYKVTDRGDNGILLTAISSSMLSKNGVRFMLCPAFYDVREDSSNNSWKGVWHESKTFSINDLTVWNGLVWKCIMIVDEPSNSPDLNDTNWELIPKNEFSNSEYVQIDFNIQYDVVNDWIEKQTDSKGNTFGMTYLQNYDPGYGFYLDYNVCDYIDWNRNIEEKQFHNNKCIAIINCSENCSIAHNVVGGIIKNVNVQELMFNHVREHIENINIPNNTMSNNYAQGINNVTCGGTK